ncbi:hypothetical protein E5676_scaffold113G00150 [Cucumis melo var. makuwa]|uniref:Uncharacterized protein n=1 Tax=Cucumis melo var. makuwa TaxID=1194695 RepID=A0A5D3BU72_CUCMM|nr:hypothetical protein E6C27_scaffold207G00310 [Cucumis melo var. makuwa]TYK01786.1 hypothetical protein E5676_scaffold113G00150 [Cucumis melo var. makuwa]
MRPKRVLGNYHSTPFLVYFGYNLIYGAIRPSARLDQEKKQEGLGAFVKKLSKWPQRLFFLIRMIPTPPLPFMEEPSKSRVASLLVGQEGHRLTTSSIIAKYKHRGLLAMGVCIIAKPGMNLQMSDNFPINLLSCFTEVGLGISDIALSLEASTSTPLL